MKVRKIFLMLFIAVPLIVMILAGLLAGIFQLKRDIAVSANTLLRFICQTPPGKSPEKPPVWLNVPALTR